MIRKSGNRFSEKIMLNKKCNDPEKWKPVFRKDHAQQKCNDPEKWKPVLRKDHAQATAGADDNEAEGEDVRQWQSGSRRTDRYGQ
jgi:hypothetical protein